jgi:hypothetical protein
MNSLGGGQSRVEGARRRGARDGHRGFHMHHVFDINYFYIPSDSKPPCYVDLRLGCLYFMCNGKEMCATRQSKELPLH